MELRIYEKLAAASGISLPVTERLGQALRASLPLRENLIPRLSDYAPIVDEQSQEFKSGIGDFSDLLLRIGEGSADKPWMLQARSGNVFFGEHLFAHFSNRRHAILQVNGTEARLGPEHAPVREGSPLNVYPLPGPPVSGTATLSAVVFNRLTGETATISTSIAGAVPALGLFFRVTKDSAEAIMRQTLGESASAHVFRSFSLQSSGDVDFYTAPDGKTPIWGRSKSEALAPRAMRRTTFLDEQGRLVLYGRHVARHQKKIYLPDTEIDRVFVSAGTVMALSDNTLLMDQTYPEVEVFYTVKGSYLYDDETFFFAQPQGWVLVEYEDAASDLWGDTLINLNPLQAKVRSGFVYMAPRDHVYEGDQATGSTSAKPVIELSAEANSIALDGGRMRILCEARDAHGSPMPFLSVAISANDPGASFVDPDVVGSTPATALVKQTDAFGQFTVELIAPNASVAKSGTLYGEARYDSERYQLVDGFETELGQLIVLADNTDKTFYDLRDELALMTYGDATNQPKLQIRYGQNDKTQLTARVPVFQWELASTYLTRLASLPWDGGRTAVASRSGSEIYLIPASGYAALTDLAPLARRQTGLSQTSDLVASPAGVLWAGGKEGLSRHTFTTETPHPLGVSVNVLALVSEDVLAIGTLNGEVLRYDAQTKQAYLIARLPGPVTAMAVSGDTLYVAQSEPAVVQAFDVSAWAVGVPDRAPNLQRFAIPAAQHAYALDAVESGFRVETESGVYDSAQGRFHLGASLANATLEALMGAEPLEAMRASGRLWHALDAGTDCWFVRDHAVGVVQRTVSSDLHRWLKVHVRLVDPDNRPLDGEPVTIQQEPNLLVLPSFQLFTGKPYVGHLRGKLVADVTVSDPKQLQEGRWYVSSQPDRSARFFDAEGNVLAAIPGVAVSLLDDRTPNAMAVIHTYPTGQATFYVSANVAGRKEPLVIADRVGALSPLIFEVI